MKIVCRSIRNTPLGWSLTIFRGRGPLFFGVGPPIISGVGPHYFLGGTIFSGAGTLVYIFYFGGHTLFTIFWGRGPPFFLAKVPTIFMGYGQGFTHLLQYCTLVIFTVNYTITQLHSYNHLRQYRYFQVSENIAQKTVRDKPCVWAQIFSGVVTQYFLGWDQDVFLRTRSIFVLLKTDVGK